ncbi:MAG: hypothetical protein WBD51_09710, partial [Burkholderiaceae bacterium]
MIYPPADHRPVAHIFLVVVLAVIPWPQVLASPHELEPVPVVTYTESSGVKTEIGIRDFVGPSEESLRYVGNVDGWQVNTAIRDGQLIVVQRRSQAGGQSREIRTRVRPPLSNLSNRQQIVPAWWPALTNLWSARADDNGFSVITLMGWLPHQIARSRQVITDACTRGGLVLRNRVPVPSTRAGTPAGEMLFYVG